MLQVRRSEERGHLDHGWLDTYHTFSFGDYHDPGHMGFRTLRVINEDFVGAGEGFGTHGHRDMEIITYILGGSLEHKDSMGNGSIIKPGEIQYMSAGKGVTHSEFNPSDKEKVHLLQIWILPDSHGYQPRYGQKQFDVTDLRNKLKLLVSPDGREDSIAIRQDAQIFASKLAGKLSYSFAKKRYGWIQLASGELNIEAGSGSVFLKAGDGLAVSEESVLQLSSKNVAEFLLFDLN